MNIFILALFNVMRIYYTNENADVNICQNLQQCAPILNTRNMFTTCSCNAQKFVFEGKKQSLERVLKIDLKRRRSSKVLESKRFVQE